MQSWKPRPIPCCEYGNKACQLREVLQWALEGSVRRADNNTKAGLNPRFFMRSHVPACVQISANLRARLIKPRWTCSALGVFADVLSPFVVVTGYGSLQCYL